MSAPATSPRPATEEVALTLGRALGGTVREQGQGGKTDEEWIRSGMTSQSKCRAQSVSLWLGQPAQTAERRLEQAVQRSKTEIALCFDARNTSDL